MKISLMLLVLFVAATCTSAYSLRRKGGKGGKGGDGPSSMDKEERPKDMCSKVIEQCADDGADKRSQEVGSGDFDEEIDECIKEFEEVKDDIVKSKRDVDADDLEAIGDCESFLKKCREPLEVETSLARSLNTLLRELEGESCEKAVKRLPKEDSGDEDAKDGSYEYDSQKGSGDDKNLARLLRELLRHK